MQCYIDVFFKIYEIFICRENRHFKNLGNGTYQEIRIGSLNPFFPIDIEKLRGFLIDMGLKRQIRKGRKMGLQRFKLVFGANTRKDFLANGPII